MSTEIKQVALNKLVPHPGNPNRMSRANFNKLVRNIERTGRYEPLVVRACPGRRGFFQIISGHRRCEALRRLGHKTAGAVVWKVDDEQTDLLLATLNRLGGRDNLEKKLTLLRRLSATRAVRELAELLPQTRGQLERLLGAKPCMRALSRKSGVFAIPIVFFVDEAQEQAIEKALAQAAARLPDEPARATRRAKALLCVAQRFLSPDQQASREGDARMVSTPPAGP
ncbi:MAG: hypothetical protein FJ280_05375 [Planctomycetes bacterium]|nr:hypothetical protein [Planctomycetota bacterium]